MTKKSNYQQYIERMAQSANESSKSLLPLYFKGCKNILDVGCADGTMMEKIREVCPDAKFTGLDLNEYNVKTVKNKGFNAYWSDLINFQSANKGIRFDGILFSSVLHEVSSYSEENRYSHIPILRTLNTADWMLTDSGVIVIRDGVEGDRNKEMHFKFKNQEDLKWLGMFCGSQIGRCLNEQFTITKSPEVNDNHNNFIITSERAFRELIFKYTWGEKSFERESKEKVGILQLKDWISLCKARFYVQTVTTSSEKYFDYLIDKIDCYNLEEILHDLMVTLVLRKKSYSQGD